ncbi:MAG: NADH-quinone oxidoreductase subunit J [Fimbriimonadales bacterium]|nr:NADH-quinone oxidoreductase subunit J [Fimbriimonadales bacterium]
MGERVLFFVLAIVAILSAGGVVFSRNPVRSALLLVLNFFTLALIYFSLSAQFIGVLQVIVYAGAIMVLFLFVIMLLNLGSPDAMPQERDLKRPLAYLIGFGILATLVSQSLALLIPATPQASPDVGTARVIGLALFTQWAYPLLLMGVLLTVGVIGSILLARRRAS